MIKAIFYKEWIKTRWYFLLALVVTTGMAGYTMLRLNRTITLKGAGHIWEVMVTRDAIFIDLLQYVPLLAGILLAVVQFVPEMQRKCLKLTLHLPCSQQKMIFSMLAFGLILLLGCFAANFIVMGLYLPQIFALQLVRHILLSAVPWYLAGITGYMLIAWTCLEPTWKRRILNLVVSAIVFRVYFLAPTPESYNGFLPWLTLYTLLTAVLSWISVTRFKAGKQD